MIPLVVWGAMLGILTAVQLQYLRLLPVLLLGGAAIGIVIVAGVVVLILAVRRRRAAPAARAIPDLSPAAVVGALGLGTLTAGAKLGAWLAIGGAGLLVLAAFLGVRELGAQRRLERPAHREERGS